MKIYVIKDKGDNTLKKYLPTARKIIKDKEVVAGYFFFLKKDAASYLTWVYENTRWKEIYEIVPFERIKK